MTIQTSYGSMKSGDKYGFYDFFSVSILVKSPKNNRKHLNCFKIIQNYLLFFGKWKETLGSIVQQITLAEGWVLPTIVFNDLE